MASAYINPAMLKWGREQTPFKTVDDVEKHKPSIKAEKLAAREAGTELPSLTAAKELAVLYKLPFAAFFLSDPPEKKTIKYKDRRTVKGTIYKENNYELWAETRRVDNNRDQIIELYSAEGIEPLRIPTFDFADSIEDIAERIRSFLKIQTPFQYKKTFGNSAFRYYRDILEHHDICVVQINGVELSEMKGFSLAYEVIPIIGINGKDYERAKVFSLFHELAHIIRRTSSLCMIDFDRRNDEEEKLCDQLAAAILMPKVTFVDLAKEIYKREGKWYPVCLMKIADKYGVSSVSVLRRLYETDVITWSEYQALYKKLQDDFESSHNNVNGTGFADYYQRYINAQGYLFSRTALIAYGAGVLTYGELCKTLNMKARHIGDLERAVMFG